MEVYLENEQEEVFTTTFWSDFSIADHFGFSAVKDTFRRAFGEWKDEYHYLTDLVLVLNQKLWYHYEEAQMAKANGKATRAAVEEAYTELYDALWRQADEYACEHLEGEAASYYFRLTN